MSKRDRATITVLGKTLTLCCDPAAEASLRCAADALNERLAQAKGRSQGRDDQLAVAALNIMHDYLALQREHAAQEQAFSDDLAALLARVEAVE